MVCRVWSWPCLMERKWLGVGAKLQIWMLEERNVRKVIDLNVMDWVLTGRFSATPFHDSLSQQCVNTQILLHCVDGPHTHSLPDHRFTARRIESEFYVLGKLSTP